MTVRAALGGALVPLLLLAGAAGCGDDDDDSAPTTTEATTTTSAPTTTTTVAPACPEVTVPAEAEERTSVDGDVDGDRARDDLRTFRVGDEWHLQVALAAGGGADLVLPTFGGGVGVVGGADVDGDGTDEVWARTGSGASTTIVGLARLVDCQLVRVTFPTGEPAELPVGGSVGTTSGVECAGDRLTAFTASFVDGTTYDVEATGYTLDGATLTPTGDPTRTTVDANDPAFLRYATFTCGDLTL